ncbi:MAG: hypothetical protein VX460_12730 [Planctomycetota bacterium]|nr:hypothetical protein [Planctomycetota bacterium]
MTTRGDTSVKAASRPRVRSRTARRSSRGPRAGFASLRGRSRSLLVASLLIVAPGCATTLLWNEPESELYDDDAGSFNLEPRVDDAGDLLLKIALTPLTLVFDICTSPLQVLFFEGDPGPLIESFGGDDGPDRPACR